MKNLPRWIPFLTLSAICIIGLIMPGQSTAPAIGSSHPGDVAWMLTATGLVLLMTPGLSFFYGGMVQKKNIISTMLQSFICMGVVSLVWITVGFSLAFGDSYGGFVGSPWTYFFFRGVGSAPHTELCPKIPLALFAMFQMKFAIITPALITGAFAERVRFIGYLVFISLFSIVIYAPVAHWTWHPNGFLHVWGVQDFAGGAVVHMSAGFAALAGAWLLGRRKVHVTGAPQAPGNIPYVILGTGMLWFGWFGFNAGSALAANETAVLAFINTHAASAAAMLGWVYFDLIRGRKATALGAAIGAVVGLVAITPAAGFVSVGASIAIGALSAVISNLAAHWKTKSNLDDTLDVFPCHGVGGICGMIATAIFSTQGGLITGSSKLLMDHLLGLVIIGGYTFFGSVLLYKLTSWIIPLRVSGKDEDIGLDLSQHGETVG